MLFACCRGGVGALLRLSVGVRLTAYIKCLLSVLLPPGASKRGGAHKLVIDDLMCYAIQ